MGENQMGESKGDALAGRVAIVTGAAGGIGEATARRLCREGARVVVNDVARNEAGEARAEHVAAVLRDAGHEAISNAESVASDSGAAAIVQAAVDHWGRLDILVNNAGRAWSGRIDDLDLDTLRDVTASHIEGTVACTRHAVAAMQEQGRVINLVSRAGITGMPGTLAYAVGKGGVFGFTNAASRELASRGITVNAVNPASTATPMVLDALKVLDEAGPEARKRADALRAAMQSPDDVARVIVALALPDAASINGQILYVEGRTVGVFEPLAVRQRFERDADASAADLLSRVMELALPELDDPYA